MIKILSYIILILLFLGCSSLKVNVDYDESYDFKNVKSFAIENNVNDSKNTLFTQRVVNALTRELELKNYKKKEAQEADLIFVFYGTIREKQSIHASYNGYVGYGRRGSSFGYSGMMLSTSTYEYQEGTLVIDALSPKNNKLVWRGVGVKVLPEFDTPAQRTEAVNEAVKKIMAKFPKR